MFIFFNVCNGLHTCGGEMMATIREVAARAGVSVATVSRVLNKNGYVKEETLEKVKQAIKDLNYTPNSVARTLFTKKSDTIGVLVPDITNPFFAELYKTIEKYAEQHDKQLFLFNSDYSLNKEKKFLKLITSRLIDSAIIVSDTLMESDLEAIEIPIVTVDRKISDNIPSISINNYQGAKEAVNYLLNRKCKVLAHITGPIGNTTASERKKGFIDEVNLQKVEYRMIQGSYDIKESVKTSITLLNQYPEIDGVFAGNDIIAVGLIKALSKINHPNSLSIIGFDGIRLGEEITPEITTLSQPIDAMAQEAIDIILTNTRQKHKVFDVNLLIRET